MAEKVIVRQDSNYETEILGPDPHDPESQKLHPIRNIYDLTSKEREKLFLISHHCPIHKMLKSDIKINSQLASDSDWEKKKKFSSPHD